jgi:hypothetical protein
MLIRIITANTTVAGITYPADTVLNADDTRAAELIEDGVATSLEAVSKDVDDIAASTHKFGCLVALAGAAVTLDLTSLASAGASRAGTSTNFSAWHTLILHNFGTTTMTLTVGNAASQQAADWLGAATSKVIIPAGGKLVIQNPLSAGYTTASKNNLKLDPGSDTFKAGVAIGGIGA